MLERLNPGRLWIAAAILSVALGFAYYAAGHPMDFRVYHKGARGVFGGTLPVYGPVSGLGWPMHYRYPPLFLLLFWPFSLLPLGAASALWTGLKVAALAWVAFAIARRGSVDRTSSVDGGETRGHRRLHKGPFTYLITVLLVAPYIIEELRYGNAQFYVFALTAGSLLMLTKRPILAAVLLALGISIKIWPIFFVPYLAVRRQWKPVWVTMAAVLILAMVPALYFGFSENINLLGQWFAQESQTQLGQSEIWFPNQSLRGVLMRYLTVIDYSRVPDSNYPQINISTMDPSFVRAIWMLVAAAAYLGFLVLANRQRNSDGWFEIGLAFCLVGLLQPFTQKYALSILLWPAIVAASLMTRPRIRILLYGATIFGLVQPVVQGASAQRLVQVLGLDFAATLSLTIALTLACVQFSDDSLRIHKTETGLTEATPNEI